MRLDPRRELRLETRWRDGVRAICSCSGAVAATPPAFFFPSAFDEDFFRRFLNGQSASPMVAGEIDRPQGGGCAEWYCEAGGRSDGGGDGKRRASVLLVDVVARRHGVVVGETTQKGVDVGSCVVVGGRGCVYS